MKHILYLPSWFPNRREPFSGDFIKRYAECASLYNRITVLFTAVDEKVKAPVIIEEKINENLTVYTYYYPLLKGRLSPLINGVRRFNALRTMYGSLLMRDPPDLVHVQVAYPAGLFALYLKKRKGLNFIISEHNTIYLPGRRHDDIAGNFERQLVPLIFRNASKIHAVSKSLAMALINRKLTKSDPVVIPNVVDTTIFHHQEKETGTVFKFIHVSSLIDQKNPKGMIAAFSIVKQRRGDFIVKIVGPLQQQLVDLTHALFLQDHIIFLGEIPYHDVAKEIQGSDAMIHFTRYETFGCTIAESLCCGVPVIVSDLDVTRELITDKVNGLLVREDDPQDLADKIILFMENGLSSNAAQLAKDNQDKFNYRRVGRMFDEIYLSIKSRSGS